jgi:hypothetical protein
VPLLCREDDEGGPGRWELVRVEAEEGEEKVEETSDLLRQGAITKEPRRRTVKTRGRGSRPGTERVGGAGKSREKLTRARSNRYQ